MPPQRHAAHICQRETSRRACVRILDSYFDKSHHFLQDFATQIWHMEKYTKECKIHKQEKGRYVPPVLAEWIAGMFDLHGFFMVCCVAFVVSLNCFMLLIGLPRDWSSPTVGSVTEDMGLYKWFDQAGPSS